MDRQNSEAALMLNLAIKQPPPQRIIMYRDTRGGVTPIDWDTGCAIF